MQGRSPIVLMLRNHGFYEHVSQGLALVEAQRLSRVHGAECVVYVPVAAAHPPQEASVERIPRLDGVCDWAEMSVTDGEARGEEPFLPLADGGPSTKISRYLAYTLVTDVLRTWPGESCPVEKLRQEAIARLGRPSLTLSVAQFGRVLADMHRAGHITVSDGFASLVERP